MTDWHGKLQCINRTSGAFYFNLNLRSRPHGITTYGSGLLPAYPACEYERDEKINTLRRSSIYEAFALRSVDMCEECRFDNVSQENLTVQKLSLFLLKVGWKSEKKLYDTSELYMPS